MAGGKTGWFRLWFSTFAAAIWGKLDGARDRKALEFPVAGVAEEVIPAHDLQEQHGRPVTTPDAMAVTSGATLSYHPSNIHVTAEYFH